MAVTQFSFLDTALYGSGMDLQSIAPQDNSHNGVPPAAVPQKQKENASAQPAKPQSSRSANEKDTQEIQRLQGDKGVISALELVQIRLNSSEKRLALMEQRLLQALDECQSRRPPVNSGCSWGLFVLTMVSFLALAMYALRQGKMQTATSSSYPFVLPAGQLPTSPPLLVGQLAANAPPPTFLPAA